MDLRNITTFIPSDNHILSRLSCFYSRFGEWKPTNSKTLCINWAWLDDNIIIQRQSKGASNYMTILFSWPMCSNIESRKLDAIVNLIIEWGQGTIIIKYNFIEVNFYQFSTNKYLCHDSASVVMTLDSQWWRHHGPMWRHIRISYTYTGTHLERELIIMKISCSWSW